MEHDWRKKHYSKPVWCALCSKFIWGLGKQGFVCRVCTYPVHPKCLALVDTPCSGQKLSHTKKTLDQAKASVPASTTTTTTSSRKAERPIPLAEDDVAVPDVDVDEDEAPKKRVAPRPFTTQASVLRIDADKEEVVEGATSINDVYTIGAELGRGAFSTVHKAVNKATGETFAVKIINKKNVQQDLHRLAIEMNILKQVDHPNIIRLQDFFETEENLYIVTEIVTGGELFDRIVSKGSYSERDAAILTKKLVLALEYLHNLNIAHRDLKPENLLLKSAEEDNEVKLADFGLSKIIGQEAAMQTACGTPGYVAPEVLLAKGYGKEVDMWSTGVICYILLCGFPPFYHEKIPLLFESIMKADYDFPPEYWDHISDDAINFIDHLLVVDPKKRMTATQALAHPWLTKNCPDTPLAVGPRMNKYMKLHKEQSRASQPTSADEAL